MPNQNMYILNNNNYDCPIGAVGNIYIGGMGVAKNYWGNEELTNNRFIDHKKYGRLYFTGDLGRWNKAGYIEFIGRKDFQVKLNGYRVELEEISSKINNIQGVDKAVVSLQKHNDRDYLIGYIVPKQKMLHKTVDPEAFKLKQKGILDDKEISYNLNPKLNEEEYRLRKSYRNFTSDKIDLELISKKYNEIKENVCTGNIVNNSFGLEDLTNLLGLLSALQLEDRALPKYRYPSGGSTYGVRCFINIGTAIGDIAAGYYYYHPTKQALCWVAESKSKATELSLIANWSSIKPLYGEISEKLTLQEAGHMLGLLLPELNKQGFGYKLQTKSEDLDDDNSLLCKVIIGGNKRELPEIKLSFNHLAQKDGCYKSPDSSKEYILNLDDIFVKNQDLSQLLLNGSHLLVEEGKAEATQIILSGLLFQRLGEELYKANIGSCMIGLEPYEGGLYTMVIGSIKEDEKKSAESKLETQPIKEVINNELADLLPDYMIPTDYIMLDVMPLTATGKLDVKKLPILEIVDTDYIAPSTELEKQLCRIWEEVLGLEKVGITDNFFRIGGDSITAIKLVSKLNSAGIACQISDIFTHHNIEKLI